MVSLVARVWWCCCGVSCCLGGWWGPLVVVDDTPGDFDAVGAMVCGVVVSTLGWGPGGRRWWRLFASCGGVLGVVVDGGAIGVTLCRGRGGGVRGVLGDGTSVRRWWGWRWCVSRWCGCFWCWCRVACVLVFGGSGRAFRGWGLAGLWSWRCRLSLVLGYSLRLSVGL